MYPKIVIGDVHIYVFGIFLIASWVVFFYLLHIFSQKKWIVKPVFSDIFGFTMGIFLFSRLFYILSNWWDTKFILQQFFSGNVGFMDFIHQVLITTDYNLSLAGGIIGFFLVFFWKTRNQKNLRMRYLDVILPSFLIAGIIGFVGAFFGGQIYGLPSGFISVDYSTKYSNIPWKLFPLAILYAILCLIIIILWKKFNKDDFPDGYSGLILLGIFGIILFIGDFFSWSPDMFEIFIRINQLIGLIFIFTAIIWIFRFFRS